MTYKTEFADFDAPAEAEMLSQAGWRDESWHNDACPVFWCADWALWIDYINPDQREFPECSRYMVQPIVSLRGSDSPAGYIGNAIEMDSMRAALAFIYSEMVGYDPFADDPGMTDSECATILGEYRREREGEA